MREQPEAPPKPAEPAGKATKHPVWHLGQEDKIPMAPRMPKAQQRSQAENMSEADKRQRHLEAYKRYKQMRDAAVAQQPEDIEEDTPPLKSRRLPAFDPDNRPKTRRRTDEWFEEAYGSRPQKSRRAKTQRNLTRDFAIAGALSIFTGLVAGIVVYDRTSNGAVTQAILSMFDGPDTPQAQAVAAPVQPALIVDPEQQQAATELKKPISTAALDVASVVGRANALVPLSLRAVGAEPGQKVGFRLTGVPAAALLTAGVKLNETTWQLRPGEENGVRLKLPPNQTQSFVIAVEAVEPTTNELLSPIHDLNVAVTQAQAQQQEIVQPAAAEAPEVQRNFNLPQDQPANQESIIDEQPGAQQQAVASMPSAMEETASEPMAETFSLMKNGDKLMSMGDPAGARQFYLKAHDLGDKQAALKIGQTYDPTIYADMNVQGLKPDPQLALRYYLEARTAGDPEAENAIAGLDSWMQR